MLGLTIKKLRKDRKFTQSDLASLLKVSVSAVTLWECDKRIPSIDVILKIANIFNVSVDYLLKQNQNNQIIILGRNGSYKQFPLNEKDLKTIENLAESLANVNFDSKE